MSLGLPHPGILITLVGYFGLLFLTTKFRDSGLGLVFVFACGLVLLLGRGGISRAAAFSLLAVAAGAQWYLFNWQATGDPLYPMLWQ